MAAFTDPGVLQNQAMQRWLTAAESERPQRWQEVTEKAHKQETFLKALYRCKSRISLSCFEHGFGRGREGIPSCAECQDGRGCCCQSGHPVLQHVWLGPCHCDFAHCVTQAKKFRSQA